MATEQRMNLVTRNTEEIITREEIQAILDGKSRPKAYWGFECSGLMHIGMGLIVGSKINDMIDAGFDFIIFLADWHSWINNKLGGDMAYIRTCGRYFIDCFTALGVPRDSVRYLWASDLANERNYWEKVVRIAKSTSLNRVQRALPIMGRSMRASDLEAASILYPCMQAADIFQMELDIACAGMDQRKAHMLARDVADKLGFRKPSCIHTPLLAGLQDPKTGVEREFDENTDLDRKIGAKMSKSIATSSILIHDSCGEIEAKIKAAYCPPKVARGNPVMEIAKYIVFPKEARLHIPRAERHGGPVEYDTYSQLESDYVRGAVHPLDLKVGVSGALSGILNEVSDYFAKHPENLEAMRKIEPTR